MALLPRRGLGAPTPCEERSERTVNLIIGTHKDVFDWINILN